LSAGVAAQSDNAPAPRAFDLVTYTVPQGYKVVEKREGGGRVEHTKASATSYCIFSLYASTPGNDLAASFAAEWEAVALRTIAAVEMPKPRTRKFGDTRVAVGSATSTAGGQPVWLRLLVIDAGARVQTLIVLTPNEGEFEVYRPEIETMLRGMIVKSVAPTEAAPQIENGRLVVPPPARQLTVADIVGEWGQNDGITTTYVDRHTGAYAGFDSLHFRNKWTITKRGEIHNDFFAIQNGKKITEKTAGTVTVAGPVLSIRQNNLAKYVERGWLELPDVTIMVLCGPWYDDQVIPPEHFTNPAKGANLDQKWVRKRVK
jgi:hypothetical protein